MTPAVINRVRFEGGGPTPDPAPEGPTPSEHEVLNPRGKHPGGWRQQPEQNQLLHMGRDRPFPTGLDEHLMGEEVWAVDSGVSGFCGRASVSVTS